MAPGGLDVGHVDKQSELTVPDPGFALGGERFRRFCILLNGRMFCMTAPLEVQVKSGRVFCPLAKNEDKWLTATPEEIVRQRTVCWLVNQYGYSLDQISQELPVVKGQRGKGRARADVAVWPTEKHGNAMSFWSSSVKPSRSRSCRTITTKA